MKDVGGDGLYNSSEEGGARNATRLSRPITALVVCVITMHNYILWEVGSGYGEGFGAEVEIVLVQCNIKFECRVRKQKALFCSLTKLW